MYPFNGPLGSKFDVQPYHTLLPTGPSYIKKNFCRGLQTYRISEAFDSSGTPQPELPLEVFRCFSSLISLNLRHWLETRKDHAKKVYKIKNQASTSKLSLHLLSKIYGTFSHIEMKFGNASIFSLPSLKKSNIGTKQSSIFFLLIIVWCEAPGRWRTPLRWVFRMIVANPRRSWLCNSASQIKHHGSCECGDPGRVSKTQRFGLRTKFEVARF